MRLFLLLPLLPLVGCVASDPALQRQYDSLEKERQTVRGEITQIGARVEQSFTDATNAERQTRHTVNAAARCSGPRGALRPSQPLAFGPVRFKYKTKTFYFTDAAPFDNGSWQCVQEAPSAR